jgi:AmmeMemoRadiSam system protein B
VDPEYDMDNSPKIRPPMVAGMFYPQKKVTLEREIAVYLENSPELKLSGPIVGMIVPHAGYLYSGGVATRAYRQIMGKQIDVVAIISPSHREYFTEISIYDGYGYSTPLGALEVEKNLAQQLAAFSPQIILSEKGHRFEEHALEVQLPILQEVLDNFKIIPIVMGEHSYDNIETLAKALAGVLSNTKALLVASSDLSHFYNVKKASILDNVVVDNLKNFNEDKLFNDLQQGSCEMCGGGPAIAVMKACKLLGANKSQVLMYRTSGDITGEYDEVVGYLSAIFYKE